MPTIEIPQMLRFVLYLIGAVGSLVVVYAIDKGVAGDAEHKLWTGFAGLLTLLAAGKTTNSEGERIIRRRRNQAGVVDWGMVLALAVVGIFLVLLFGIRIDID